jgi:hypothetical protein
MQHRPDTLAAQRPRQAVLLQPDNDLHCRGEPRALQLMSQTIRYRLPVSRAVP